MVTKTSAGAGWQRAVITLTGTVVGVVMIVTLYWAQSVFIPVALAGFLTFGSLTQGNVLNNFPSDNTVVNIARLCFGLNMLTTLPLEAFVCREVMLNYWFPGEPFNMNLHLIFSTSLVVTSMTLSLITCDLGAVFELIGATSACALAYILPPLCYIKLSTRSWKICAPATDVASSEDVPSNGHATTGHL